jgi:hypothetical protein
MQKIIGKHKMYFQPLNMFRQMNCHLQGVFIRELQVLSASDADVFSTSKYVSANELPSSGGIYQ